MLPVSTLPVMEFMGKCIKYFFTFSKDRAQSYCYVYRLTWLLKEWLYRDRSWESPCTLGSAIFQFMGMGVGFWSSIVLLTTSEVSYSHYLLVSIDDVVS